MAEVRQDINTNYNNYWNAYNVTDDSGISTAGANGITGMAAWECYMLVKYGKAGQFGIGGDYEYLIELPIYPEQVTESIDPNWGKQNVLGRSSPLSAYANTDLKRVSFSLDLHRDFLTGSFSHTQASMMAIPGMTGPKQVAGRQKQTAKGPFHTRSWYTSINKMLQIACYPQYTSVGLIPPTTYFIFGQMILKGYLVSYQTSWKKPILNSFYGWNTVDISMECYPDTIISARDILTNNRKGTASTQNTYNTTFPNNVGKSDVLNRSETTNRSNARTDESIGGSLRVT